VIHSTKTLGCPTRELIRSRSTQSGSGESHSNTFPSRSSLAGKPIGKAARTNHNEVEKKYRNRLNDQFETLAQKLPKEGGDGKGEKRVSKADVLIQAKTHIEELQRGEKALEDENLELEEAAKDLKRRWVGLGVFVCHDLRMGLCWSWNCSEQQSNNYMTSKTHSTCNKQSQDSSKAFPTPSPYYQLKFPASFKTFCLCFNHVRYEHPSCQRDRIFPSTLDPRIIHHFNKS